MSTSKTGSHTQGLAAKRAICLIYPYYRCHCHYCSGRGRWCLSSATLVCAERGSPLGLRGSSPRPHHAGSCWPALASSVPVNHLQDGVHPAPFWLFSEFGAIYKYSDLFTYLLTYLLTYFLTTITFSLHLPILFFGRSLTPGQARSPVTKWVTEEINPKGAREGTHRPFPNYNITGPRNHNNKRFNVSARSDARRPTDSDSSVARCTKNS